MSANGVRPQHYGARSTKNAEPQDGDEAGAYSREELARFDARFCERLLRAFATGRESREAVRTNVWCEGVAPALEIGAHARPQLTPRSLTW
jgi:hypothetical protein